MYFIVLEKGAESSVFTDFLDVDPEFSGSAPVPEFILTHISEIPTIERRKAASSRYRVPISLGIQ